MTPTTRRYPRTAIEAWPRTTAYACAVTVYPTSRIERLAGVALAVCIGVALAVWVWVGAA
jgi:hypothetical protein